MPIHYILGSVWIELILLKLKTKNWKHCSKIIFKYVNSTVGPIFNEKIAEKWNLWVHEQCTYALFTREKSTFAATVQWTVAAFLQNAWKQKKKKRTKMQLVTNADAASVNPNGHLYTLFFFCVLDKWQVTDNPREHHSKIQTLPLLFFNITL